MLSIVFIFLSQLSQANVVGSDAQNFSPTQDGLDFVTVHSSETLDPGIINMGFFINYAVNTFPAFEGSGTVPTQSLLDKNDSLTSADLNFAIGIAKGFQLGLSFPYLIKQTIESTVNLGRFEGSGTSEIRAAGKYRLAEFSGWGLATIFSANFNRIKNNPYLGDKSGPTFNLEFALDKKFGHWNWALNLGHRWRDPGTPFTTTGIDPLPSQFIASTAGSYLFSKINTKLIVEAYGSWPTKSTQNLSNRQNSSLEALAGVKHDYSQQLAIHGGLGTELGQGTSTPDYRVYTGINYALGPLYSKPSYVEKVTQNKVSITLPNLMFEFDSDVLVPASERIVGEVIARIKKIQAVEKIIIEGHTDSIGTEEYNQGLSERRAATIYNYLVGGDNFDKEKVESRGFGETRPIDDNGNFQGRQRNRRVEIIVKN